MKRWRFLDTGNGNPYVNMAVDEALMLAYDPCYSLPVLRIYGWLPASFSIGYSQDPVVELDLERCRKNGMLFVRRMTGGGVIFHGRGLTYSIVCSEHDIAKRCFAKEAYRFLCSFIVEAYNSMGLEAGFSLIADKPPGRGWVCFRERERYDIVINGKKIGGNAQRRKKGLIFQHGFIPLYPDIDRQSGFFNIKPAPAKYGACSLSEVAGRDIGYDEFKEIFICSFEKTFNTRLVKNTLNRAEKALWPALLKTKYSTREWNLSRHDGKDKALVA
jgi:lipoyl(octanoyl) transferase